MEDRLNGAILRHIPNAVAVHGTFGEANVIFANESKDDFGMVIETPQLLVAVGDWPTPAEGDSVTIAGDGYTLRTPEAAHNGAWWRIGLQT